MRLRLSPLLLLLALLAALPGAARAAAPFRPGQVVVREDGRYRLVPTRPGESVLAATARLRQTPGITDAEPNYVARAAAFPNDPGAGAGWAKVQWNFLSGAGVDAPRAWRNLIAKGRPGGRGVRVAVLDSGVAYTASGAFPRSPDLNHTRFLPGYDYVGHDRKPVDAYGHGTLVASLIAGSTNNGVAVTGLAYGASLMPVRVLDAQGLGDAFTVAQGIRYAVRHHAQVINLSLDFPKGLTASDLSGLRSALDAARRARVLVVAAAGNRTTRSESAAGVNEPARQPDVLGVGATTSHGCAGWYSRYGKGIDLVAPGGGEDAVRPGDPRCHARADQPPITELSFRSCAEDLLPCGPGNFFLRGDIGTSMAAPHASAAAALVIASGVLGAHPSPARIISRLERTADPLGPKGFDRVYGYGRVDAGRATAP